MSNEKLVRILQKEGFELDTFVDSPEGTRFLEDYSAGLGSKLKAGEILGYVVLPRFSSPTNQFKVYVKPRVP